MESSISSIDIISNSKFLRLKKKPIMAIRNIRFEKSIKKVKLIVYFCIKLDFKGNFDFVECKTLRMRG